jgi:L-2,4-diaminobutyric acid acetyltransferase
VDLASKIRIEHPRSNDAESLRGLARGFGPLNADASSFYRMWCRDFSGTSAIARLSDSTEVIGYVSAFRRPLERGTLVIWQAVVTPSYRGRRLAVRMLDWLADSSYKHIETIAPPSNTAYDRFLKAFARKRSAAIEYLPYSYSTENYDNSREVDYLYRIGPL